MSATKYTRANTNALAWNTAPTAAYEPVTFAAWCYVEDVTNTQVVFGHIEDSTHLATLNIMGGVANDPVRAYKRDGGAARYAEVASALTVNTWHHIVGIWAGDADRWVYVDNSGSQNTQSVTDPATKNMNVGAQAGVGNAFDGHMVWPCVWDAELSADDIDALFNGAHPQHVRGDKIVWHEHHLWQMASNPSVIGVDPDAYNGTWAAPTVVSPKGLVPIYAGALL